MKLGVVTHYMPPHQGGIEHVAEVLFSGYTDAGIDVRWIASRVPAAAPAREARRIRVRCWNGLERGLGVPVPIWSPEGWRELARLVQWADALHVHDCLYPSSAVAVALARRAGKPVLLSQHVGFVHYALPVLNWLERAAYATVGRATLRGASRVVFATPAAARYVAALLEILPERTSAIPNGIDTTRFRPVTLAERRTARESLRLPLDRPIVLFAGRLVAKKGIDLVLGVSDHLPGMHFLIVGDGPMQPLLRKRRHNVSWIPAVLPERMPDCYSACDCVLLPSRDEGLPLVVQEAMASERPAVISEDEPYAPDLIKAGVCAGAPRAEPLLSAEVRRLVEGEARDMGVRARAYAEAHWDYKKMLDSYARVLEDMTATATPARR
jgi:glycosyltransferase involved in cell wall biosynthesis